MLQPYDDVSLEDSVLIDLLQVFYWRVFSMKNNGDCKKEEHIHKHEVLAMLEDAINAVKGQ